MKTKKEMKQMAKKCKALRQVIPHHSMSGTDNWGNLDKQVKILERCESLSENKIRNLLDNRIDNLEDDGIDWSEDAIVRAYDWVLGNIDEDLVEDEDIETFTEKAKREGNLPA